MVHIKKIFAKKQCWGDTSLVVQGLGLGAFTAKGPGSICSWGTKIPQAVQCGQKETVLGALPSALTPVDGAAGPHLPRLGQGAPQPSCSPGPHCVRICRWAVESLVLTEACPVPPRLVLEETWVRPGPRPGGPQAVEVAACREEAGLF